MRDRKYFHERFGGQGQKGDIREKVLLVNDPLAVEKMVGNLTETRKIADHYEYQAYTGKYQGLELSVCSTGLGGGSASIAVDELARLGGRTFLFVDAWYPRGDRKTDGSYWVASGAVRHDGASLDYAREEFPAVAHPEMILSSLHTLNSSRKKARQGLFLALAPGTMTLERLGLDQGTLDMEMTLSAPETATILTLCTIYRFRAGAIQIQVDSEDQVEKAQAEIFQIGLDVLQTLDRWDEKKEQLGWKVMTFDGIGES